MQHWLDYVKASYALVLETEQRISFSLDHEVEAYVVHLFARSFNRVDIGDTPVAIRLMSGIQTPALLIDTADECLLIHSYPIKRSRWPSETYYRDMGTVAYGLAGNTLMEGNFVPASTVLREVFKRI